MVLDIVNSRKRRVGIKSAVWDGVDQATGGYIVVTKEGKCSCISYI